MAPPSPLLARLGEIASEAAVIAQAAKIGLQRELKADGSIVTNGDREVETFLRGRLTTLVPGTTIWGEEFGHADPGEAGLWVVDPIDGTSNYAFGSPMWGITIALVVNDNIEIAAVQLPELREAYLAERGQGAWMNGTPMQPILPGAIKDEELVSCGDGVLRQYASELPGRARLTGSFVIDGTFVATQRFRGIIGNRERLYDVAGCVLMCQELGADIRYADGSPFDIKALTQNVRIGRPWIIFPKGTDFHLD